MKILALKTALLLGLLGIFMPSRSLACNLTHTTLLSLNTSGPNPVVNARLCIGAGRTGAVNGADGDTFDFAWGFFRAAGPINVLSFTPVNITSIFRACTMPGFDIGPVPGAPFDTKATIYYAMDPYADPDCGVGPGFTCITSTVLCGPEHQECFNFSFTLSAVPDSIRVFGVEGGGNPVAGCYPNPDMLINLTALPVVWGEFRGTSLPEGNRLDWSTLQETNNDHFEVLRSTDGQNFSAISTLDSDAQGGEQKQRNYTFLDANPPQGPAQYRIRQVDQNGRTDETEVVVLNYTAPAGLEWNTVGPVPTHDVVNLRFLSEKTRTMRLTLVDMGGKVVQQQSLTAQVGSNTLDLDMSTLNAGMYFLRLQGPDGKLDYKVMKF